MLVFKSKPKSVNEQTIFNHDSPLLMGFIALGGLCQFWSGFTEFIGLNGYLVDLCAFYLSTTVAKVIGNTIAFGIALTIELATFALITFIVNSFYNGYLKLKKDAATANKVRIGNWIKFIVAIGVLSFVVWLSSTVSKKNVEHSTNANPPKAKTESIERFSKAQKDQITAVEGRYEADRLQASDNYEENKRLAQNRFNAIEFDLNEEVLGYERKQLRTGKKFPTRINQLNQQIRQLNITRSDSLQALKNRNDRHLEDLQTDRNIAISRIEQTIGKDKSIVQNRNSQIEVATENRNIWLSLFLRKYAQFAVFGFLFARIWICISYNTCGIQPKVFVRPEFFESSLLKDLSLLVYTYPTRLLHNVIRKYLAKIPPLVPIESKGALTTLNASATQVQQELSVYVHPAASSLGISVYDELIQKELTANQNDDALSANANQDPQELSVYIPPLASNLGTSVYDEIIQKELNANQIDYALSASANQAPQELSVHVHPAVSSSDTNGYDELIQKELNVNQNDDASSANDALLNRRPIGFYPSSKMPLDDAYENRIYDASVPTEIAVQKAFIKQCEYCQTDFTPNHRKHRFCKDDCRKRSWEERTGRKLKLKSKKKS